MNKLIRLIRLTNEKSAKGHLQDYLRVILIWSPLVSVLFIIGFGGVDQFASRFLISMVISITVSSACFLGAWGTRVFVNGIQKHRGKGNIPDNVMWGLLSSYPFLLPGLYIGFALAGKASQLIQKPWTPPEFTDYSSGVVFGLMVSGMFSVFRLSKDAREAKQAAEVRFKSLENEKLKAQVSALSAQMNPHLLFNSLNTIASAISTDPVSAEEMTVQLSELYRGILKSAKGDQHSLENELSLCTSYLEIEKKRFGERIKYSIKIDPELDIQKIQIPVLLLQPLVENSIKHGIAPKKEGGRIQILVARESSNLIFKVIDNGVGPHSGLTKPGTGTGLSNCENRIKLKYGPLSRFDFVRTEQGQTKVQIQFPIPISESTHA